MSDLEVKIVALESEVECLKSLLKKEHEVGGTWCAKYYDLLAKMPRWIPVSEKLPPSDDSLVMVYDGDGEVSFAIRSQMWLSCDGLWYHGDRLENVGVNFTHWSPVLPFPKDGEE